MMNCYQLLGIYLIAWLSINACQSTDAEHPLFVKNLDNIRYLQMEFEDSLDVQLYQPIVVQRSDTFHLIVRMQDAKTGFSQLGLYIGDGINYTFRGTIETSLFDRTTESCRVIRRNEGDYLMTYVLRSAGSSTLMLASSQDLQHWNSIGPAFSEDFSCKDGGVIIGQYIDADLVAKKIDGKYWMIWNNGTLHLATSQDLIHWEPFKTPSGALHILFGQSDEGFDADQILLGPSPIWTEEGILMIYHGREIRTKDASGTIHPGQVVLSMVEPYVIIARSPVPMIEVNSDASKVLQIYSVVQTFPGNFTFFAGSEKNDLFNISVSNSH